MILDTWAEQWGINSFILQDLKEKLGLIPNWAHVSLQNPLSEAAVQQRIRLDAAGRGNILLRNNNGAMMNAKGQMIRYGLANDSKKMNEHIKSSDLIGITPYLIIPEDAGRIIGIFTSYETKKENWKYSNTPREQAQLRWGELVISKGGIFKFVTCVEDIR